MVEILLALGQAFILGLLTPLTAVCVLPLYPGFLAFLTNRLGKNSTNRKYLLLFGLLATLGVVLFMFLLGLLFTIVFRVSLTNVINVISPIAFVLLAVISLLMIFNVDFSRFLPQINAPKSNNPHLDAFLFGFFFGPIIIPCNPGFIAAFFATAFTTLDVVSNMGQFLAFGTGIGFPLIVLSVLSSTFSKQIIGFFTNNKRWINLIAGILLLGLSLYELIFVFMVFG